MEAKVQVVMGEEFTVERRSNILDRTVEKGRGSRSVPV